MLNITFEGSIDAMKKSNIVNKDIRINNEIRNKVAQDTTESSNVNKQIFAMLLQTIIYQIRNLETFMQQLNLALVV